MNVSDYSAWTRAGLALNGEAADAFTERFKAPPSHRFEGEGRLTFIDADVDAARAAGLLLSMEAKT